MTEKEEAKIAKDVLYNAVNLAEIRCITTAEAFEIIIDRAGRAGDYVTVYWNRSVRDSLFSLKSSRMRIKEKVTF